jgi:hypothetical protein
MGLHNRYSIATSDLTSPDHTSDSDIDCWVYSWVFEGWSHPTAPDIAQRSILCQPGAGSKQAEGFTISIPRSPERKGSSELSTSSIARTAVSSRKTGKKPQTPAHVLGLLRRLVRFGEKNALCPGVGFQIEKPKVGSRKSGALPAGTRPMPSLRHTFASALASGGQVDLYTLQKLLTHRSFAMTQRYSHPHDEALKRGSEVASEIFTAGEMNLRVMK